MRIRFDHDRRRARPWAGSFSLHSASFIHENTSNVIGHPGLETSADDTGEQRTKNGSDQKGDVTITRRAVWGGIPLGCPRMQESIVFFFSGRQ
jgi:hypothetical protein